MLRHILILSIALTYSFGNHIKHVKDHEVKDGKSDVFDEKKSVPITEPPKKVYDAVKTKLVDVSDTNVNDPRNAPRILTPTPPNPFRPRFKGQSFVVGPPQFRDANGIENNGNSVAQSNELKSSDAIKSGPDVLPLSDEGKDALEKTLSRMQDALRMLKDALNNSKIKITAKRSSGRSNTKKELKKTLSKLEKDFLSLKSYFQNE
ncbi:uncharacterized protein LOC136090425 isoform X1 [Hydra vulgaris]|uniref:Uncharacterized protein LOC136090425 isoform X1 n=1 Tax=Hydra vulgaris TaxID=6087 RepID=A0ABM4DFB7_HYDVU